MSEAHIIINGVTLTEPQSMALRVAITGHLVQMSLEGALGEDATGEAIRELYFQRSAEVARLLNGSATRFRETTKPWTPPPESERHEGYECRAILPVRWEKSSLLGTMDWCATEPALRIEYAATGWLPAQEQEIGR